MRDMSQKINLLEVERAIVFMTKAFQASRNNEKPVILHSVRVGLSLLDRGYGLDVVVAGLFHDLLEDSGVSNEAIIEEFGDRVLTLVKANSFNPDIPSREERDRELIERCAAAGNEALVIKAADILDNMPYYKLAKDKELYQLLIGKVDYFLEASKKVIGDEGIWGEVDNELAKL